MSINVQFIIDAEGNKTAAILPLEKYEEYEEFMEARHLERIARESKEEERIPWSQIRAEMVAEGKLGE